MKIRVRIPSYPQINFTKMKSYKGWFMCSILLIILGIVLALTPVESFTIFIAIGLMISGILMMSLGVIAFIGKIKPRFFKFIHLINRVNLDDKSVEIVKELKRQDITYDWDWLRNPIKNEVACFCKVGSESYIKLIGVIYANDESEALKIINNQEIDVKLTESQTLLRLMS